MDPVSAIANAIAAVANLITEMVKANPQAASDMAKRWDDSLTALGKLFPPPTS